MVLVITMVIIILYLEVLCIYSVVTLDLVRNYERQKWLSLKLLERLNQAHLINSPKKQYTSYRKTTKNWDVHLAGGRWKEGDSMISWQALINKYCPCTPLQIYRQSWEKYMTWNSTFSFNFCVHLSRIRDTYLKRKRIFQPFTEIIFCWEEIKNKCVKTPGRWNSTSVFFIFWLKTKPKGIGKQ